MSRPPGAIAPPLGIEVEMTHLLQPINTGVPATGHSFWSSELTY